MKFSESAVSKAILSTVYSHDKGSELSYVFNFFRNTPEKPLFTSES